MTANSYLAGCVLALMAGTCSVAQDSSSASQPPPSPTSSQNRAHHTAHHIQVPIEDSQSPELAQAETAIEKRDYAAAEPLLRHAVNGDSASYVAWFDLGFVENALGKVDDSIVAYRKSVAAKSDVFESNLNLGLQLARIGHPDAEVFLRAATQLKPTSHAAEGQYRAWISLAQTIAKSKPKEALAAYQHAATLQPQETEPHISAGQLFEQEQNFADAEQEYKQAQALDPHATDAVIGLANIYMRGRRFPEAEDCLRKLVADHADSGPVHFQLGRVLSAEGKNDAAIAELQAGIKLSPNDEAAQRDLAELYSTAGKNDLAEVAYRGMIASHSGDADLHRRLGQALLRQKKFPEAQQEFITAVKLKPDLGEAYGDLAFAADENKDYPLTIRALDARARQLPETPITYFLRATAYDHLRDFKNASANYRLFLNVAGGKYPDQEWQARHRLIAIEPKK
jgi:tetratricopeptide (TPR) repeat protein